MRIASLLLFLAVSLPAQEQFWNDAKLNLPESVEQCRFAFGDIDNDGDNDVVCLRTWPGSAVSILRNNGSAFFTPLAPGDLGATSLVSEGATFGDVDGDGDRDLFFTGYQTGGPRLWRNDGGRFTDVTATAVPPGLTNVHDIALLDFEGDGDLDAWFAMGVTSPTTQRNALNDGTGVFSLRHPHFNMGMAQWCWQAIPADIDADGDMDLLTVSTDGFWSAVNDGLGQFTMILPPTYANTTGQLAVGDLDGDGDVDAIQDGIRFNNGSGVFAPPVAIAPPGSAEPLLQVLADLDGDGDLDLLGRGYGTYPRLLNNGSGAFAQAPAPIIEQLASYGATSRVGAADLDGDGLPDLLFGWPMRTGLIRTAGATGVTDLSSVATPLLRRSLCAADIDNDGDVDVVATFATCVNVGGGVLHVDPALQACTSDCNIAVGDVDGDGLPDLCIGRFGLTIRRNTGTQGAASFNAIYATLNNVQGRPMVLLDLESDGDLDLYSDASLFRNDGPNQLIDVTSAAFGNVAPGGTVQAGDMDGDGDQDIVMAKTTSTEVLANDGLGSFSLRSTLPRSNRADVLRLADLDSDGDLDVLISWSRFLHVDWNQGNGSLLAGPSLFTALESIDDFHAGDFDLDGDTDIVAGLFTEAYMLRNAGGTFVAARIEDSRFQGYANGMLATADIDGDGDLDVATSNRPLPVLWNLERHLRTLQRARVGQPLTVRVEADAGSAGPTAVLLAIGARAATATHLPSIGSTPLDLATAWLGLFALPSPSGLLDVLLTVPAVPSLVGTELWSHAALLDASGIRLINAVRETITP